MILKKKTMSFLLNHSRIIPIVVRTPLFCSLLSCRMLDEIISIQQSDQVLDWYYSLALIFYKLHENDCNGEINMIKVRPEDIQYEIA